MQQIDLKNIARQLPIRKGAWEEYFFMCALAGTIRADCTRRQFSCIAVSNEKRILATGYNSPPKGVPSAVQEYEARHKKPVPKDFPCCKDPLLPSNQSYDSCNSLHAEQNCLQQIGSQNHYEWIDLYLAGRSGQSGELVDCSPCIYCARMIRSFNIRNVHCLQSDGGVKTFKPEDLPLGNMLTRHSEPKQRHSEPKAKESRS